MDRSNRTLIAIMLFVGALFVALNRAVQAAPLGDWWLAVALAVLGVVLLLPWEAWAARESERAAASAAREAAMNPPPDTMASEGRPVPVMNSMISEGRAMAAMAAEVSPLPFEDDDYGRIRDTEVRADALASAATMDTAEARANEGMVENVMETGATGTVEEVDEIAGGPVESLSSTSDLAEMRATGTMRAVKGVELSSPSEAPDVKADVPAGELDRTLADTEVRADAFASAATMDTPEARANEGMVENVMETGATGTVEEVDEIAGGPTASLSRDAIEESAAPASDVDMAADAPIEAGGPPADALAPEASAPDKTADLTETPIEEQLVKSAMEAPPEARPPKPPDEDNIVPQPISEAIVQQAQDEVTPRAKDDLTIIEGIGPKMSAALIAAGINSFAALAESSEENIRTAISAAGMRFAPSVPTWAEQARYAMRGDWDGLRTFQNTLKSGRRG